MRVKCRLQIFSLWEINFRTHIMVVKFCDSHCMRTTRAHHGLCHCIWLLNHVCRPTSLLYTVCSGVGTVGSGGQIKWPPKNVPGVKHVVFWPPDFFGKKYFLVQTHTESTSQLYYTLKLYGLGQCFLLSFITHLWTPRNVGGEWVYIVS